MKPGPRIAIAIVAAGIAAIAVQWYLAISREAPPAAAAATTAPRTQPVPSPAQQPVAPAASIAPEAASEGDGMRRVPLLPVDARSPAWISMAQARQSGDDRAPPLERSVPAEHPAASVLADHDAYAASQLAQKQRLAAAYVQAAGPELANLQADLERGREAGVPPEELARVAEKIRRIEQQRKAADALLAKGKGK